MSQNNCPLEEFEQKSLAAFLDDIGIVWCHIPNGGKRNKITGKNLKLQGVKKGVPDNFIFQSPPKYPDKCGTVIELKRVKGGSTTKEQKEWLKKLKENNWYVAVCKGAKEASDLVIELGYVKGYKNVLSKK